MEPSVFSLVPQPVNLLLALLSCTVTMVLSQSDGGGPTDVTISRHHLGDMFSFQDSSSCSNEVCSSRSSATGQIYRVTPRGGCQCQCLPALPTYRDDMNVCVSDFSECTLSPFVSSGTTFQKIPFVFLPLKGQIIHPSAEILVQDISSGPLCVVSKSRYLTTSGWVEIGNQSTDFESPFKLHKDHNQVYLQWMGDTDLRHEMEGRLVLVSLMCKTKETKISTTPCIAFRVAGSPSIKEVLFSPDVAASFDPSASSSAWDYISLAGIAFILGLIYVTSVALYLYNKKRNAATSATGGGGGEEGKAAQGDKIGVGAPMMIKQEVIDERGVGRTIPEEGLIKSNPLLHHCHDNGDYMSDEFTNESDDQEDHMDNIINSNNINHFTSATIHHSLADDLYSTEHYGQSQDPLSNEKLPEENVSIIESMDKDDKGPPETVRAMSCGTARRKLYFNPAYFEHDLLIQPPAAAIEFLIKIREVIAIAKQKMSLKKYLPGLIKIPEEETLVIPKPSLKSSDLFETSPYERYQSGYTGQGNNNLNPPSKIQVDELNFMMFDQDGNNNTAASGQDCFYSNNESNCLINEQNNEFIYNKYRQDWNYNKEMDSEEQRSNASYNKDEMMSHRSKQDTLRSNHSARDDRSYRDEVKSNCSHRSYRSQCSYRSNRDDVKSNHSYKEDTRLDVRSNCSHRSSNRDDVRSNHSYKDELRSVRSQLDEARSNHSYKDELRSVRSQKTNTLDEIRSNTSGRDRRQCDQNPHSSCNTFKCNCHCSKQRNGKAQCGSEFTYNLKHEDKCKLPSSRKSTHSEMLPHDRESVQSFRSLCHNDKCTRRAGTMPLATTPVKPTVPVTHNKQDSIHKWLQNIDVNRNQIVDMKDEIDQSIEAKPFIKPTRNKEKFSNYKKQKAPSPPKDGGKTKEESTNGTLDRKLDSRHSQNYRGRGEMRGEMSSSMEEDEETDPDGQIYEDNTEFNNRTKQTNNNNIIANTITTKTQPDDKKHHQRLPNFSLLHRTNSMKGITNSTNVVEPETKSNQTKNNQNKTSDVKKTEHDSNNNETNQEPNANQAAKLPQFKVNKPSQLHNSLMRSMANAALSQDQDLDSLEKSLYEQQIYQESESIRTPSDYDDIVKDITAISSIRKHFNNLQYDEHDYEIVGNKNNVPTTPAAHTKDTTTPEEDTSTKPIQRNQLEEDVKRPFETNQQVMNRSSHSNGLQEILKSEEREVEGEEAPGKPTVGMEEFIKQNEGYSLISEIYINDSYNMHSSSLTNSTSSLSDSTDQGSEKLGADRIKINAHEGHLTIELEDDPQEYPIVNDSFEPDTLDRKDLNNNRSGQDTTDVTSVSDIYMDSLERTPLNTKRLVKNNLKTLRNIFELNSKMLTGQEEGTGIVAKQFNGSDVPPPNSLLSYNFIPKPPFDIHSDHDDSDTDYSQLSWCTNSEKQAKFSKRQRAPAAPTPPKLPPRNPNPSHDYYEFSVPSKNPIQEIVPPLPPRSIKPPLPPKNSQRRSADPPTSVKFLNRPLPDLPEDGTSVIQQDQDIYQAVIETNQSVFEQTAPPSDNIYNEIKTDVLAPVNTGFEFNNQKNLTPFEIFQLKRNRKLVRKPSTDSLLDENTKKETNERLDGENDDRGTPIEQNNAKTRRESGKQNQDLSVKEQMNKVLKQITTKGNTFDKPSKTSENNEDTKEDMEEPYYNVRNPPNQPEKETNRVRNASKKTNKLLENADQIPRYGLTKLKGRLTSSTPSSPASSLNEFYENKTFHGTSQPQVPTQLIKSFRKLSESSEYEFILPRSKHDSNVIIRHKSKHSQNTNKQKNNDSGYLSTSTSSGSETDENMMGGESDFSNDNESTSTNFTFYKH
uniref:Shavenoid isoform B-like N-terminal domain-containing protein n=1 Tax=Cacopsylla melanoneura TaxID=428564 RepID=A0A8D9AX16_9HEMI